THAEPAVLNDVLLSASYRAEEEQAGSFAGVFGDLARRYFDRYGDHREALARIAAKNHANGAGNPYAHLRKDLGFEFCNTVSDRNPVVADPLRRTDCSLVSDGAAAVVVASRDVAVKAQRAVTWRGRAHANDHLPLSRRGDVLVFGGARRAFTQAMTEAGASLTDLDLLETHDCFTIAELLQYEAFGLTEVGKGASAIEDGRTHRGGELPVNPSGGLKAKGHPIGATGISQHVMAALQLTGEAGPRRTRAAGLAAGSTRGGVAVANSFAVLARWRCPNSGARSISRTCSPRSRDGSRGATRWCTGRCDCRGGSSMPGPRRSPSSCGLAVSSAATPCWCTRPTITS